MKTAVGLRRLFQFSRRMHKPEEPGAGFLGVRRLGAAFKSGAQAPHSKKRFRKVGGDRQHDLRN